MRAVPPAIAEAAAAGQSSGDSSYLLTLMQVAEKLAAIGDQTAVAAFSEALVKEFDSAPGPFERAALARAAVPLLARDSGSPTPLTMFIARETLIPEKIGEDLDPSQKAESALEQAFPSSDGVPQEGRPEEALRILDAEWRAESSPHTGANPYRLAAQARLVALLAPSLMPESGLIGPITEDLLNMLPRTEDYVTHEALTRAFAGLGSKLPDAQREKALVAAKTALGKTGSTEEASAWAIAIAALLPHDPRAATAQIVEALKYPTAAGAPTEILRGALATTWPGEYKVIRDRNYFDDPTVLYWLQAHLPAGYSLTDPPVRPPGLQPNAAVPGHG